MDPSHCCSYISNVYIHRLLIVQPDIHLFSNHGLLCSCSFALSLCLLAPHDIIMHCFSAVGDVHMFWLVNGSIVVYNDIDSLLRASDCLLWLPSVPHNFRAPVSIFLTSPHCSFSMWWGVVLLYCMCWVHESSWKLLAYNNCCSRLVGHTISDS